MPSLPPSARYFEGEVSAPEEEEGSVGSEISSTLQSSEPISEKPPVVPSSNPSPMIRAIVNTGVTRSVADIDVAVASIERKMLYVDKLIGQFMELMKREQAAVLQQSRSIQVLRSVVDNSVGEIRKILKAAANHTGANHHSLFPDSNEQDWLALERIYGIQLIRPGKETHVQLLAILMIQRNWRGFMSRRRVYRIRRIKAHDFKRREKEKSDLQAQMRAERDMLLGSMKEVTEGMLTSHQIEIEKRLAALHDHYQGRLRLLLLGAGGPGSGAGNAASVHENLLPGTTFGAAGIQPDLEESAFYDRREREAARAIAKRLRVWNDNSESQVANLGGGGTGVAGSGGEGGLMGYSPFMTSKKHSVNRAYSPFKASRTAADGSHGGAGHGAAAGTGAYNNPATSFSFDTSQSNKGGGLSHTNPTLLEQMLQEQKDPCEVFRAHFTGKQDLRGAQKELESFLDRLTANFNDLFEFQKEEFRRQAAARVEREKEIDLERQKDQKLWKLAIAEKQQFEAIEKIKTDIVGALLAGMPHGSNGLAGPNGSGGPGGYKYSYNKDGKTDPATGLSTGEYKLDNTSKDMLQYLEKLDMLRKAAPLQPAGEWILAEMEAEIREQNRYLHNLQVRDTDETLARMKAAEVPPTKIVEPPREPSTSSDEEEDPEDREGRHFTADPETKVARKEQQKMSNEITKSSERRKTAEAVKHSLETVSKPGAPSTKDPSTDKKLGDLNFREKIQEKLSILVQDGSIDSVKQEILDRLMKSYSVGNESLNKSFDDENESCVQQSCVQPSRDVERLEEPTTMVGKQRIRNHRAKKEAANETRDNVKEGTHKTASVDTNKTRDNVKEGTHKTAIVDITGNAKEAPSEKDKRAKKKAKRQVEPPSVNEFLSSFMNQRYMEGSHNAEPGGGGRYSPGRNPHSRTTLLHSLRSPHSARSSPSLRSPHSARSSSVSPLRQSVVARLNRSSPGRNNTASTTSSSPARNNASHYGTSSGKVSNLDRNHPGHVLKGQGRYNKQNSPRMSPRPPGSPRIPLVNTTSPMGKNPAVVSNGAGVASSQSFTVGASQGTSPRGLGFSPSKGASPKGTFDNAVAQPLLTYGNSLADTRAQIEKNLNSPTHLHSSLNAPLEQAKFAANSNPNSKPASPLQSGNSLQHQQQNSVSSLQSANSLQTQPHQSFSSTLLQTQPQQRRAQQRPYSITLIALNPRANNRESIKAKVNFLSSRIIPSELIASSACEFARKNVKPSWFDGQEWRTIIRDNMEEYLGLPDSNSFSSEDEPSYFGTSSNQQSGIITHRGFIPTTTPRGRISSSMLGNHGQDDFDHPSSDNSIMPTTTDLTVLGDVSATIFEDEALTISSPNHASRNAQQQSKQQSQKKGGLFSVFRSKSGNKTQTGKGGKGTLGRSFSPTGTTVGVTTIRNIAIDGQSLNSVAVKTSYPFVTREKPAAFPFWPFKRKKSSKNLKTGGEDDEREVLIDDVIEKEAQIEKEKIIAQSKARNRCLASKEGAKLAGMKRIRSLSPHEPITGSLNCFASSGSEHCCAREMESIDDYSSRTLSPPQDTATPVSSSKVTLSRATSKQGSEKCDKRDKVCEENEPNHGGDDAGGGYKKGGSPCRATDRGREVGGKDRSSGKDRHGKDRDHVRITKDSDYQNSTSNKTKEKANEDSHGSKKSSSPKSRSQSPLMKQLLKLPETLESFHTNMLTKSLLNKSTFGILKPNVIRNNRSEVSGSPEDSPLRLSCGGEGGDSFDSPLRSVVKNSIVGSYGSGGASSPTSSMIPNRDGGAGIPNSPYNNKIDGRGAAVGRGTAGNNIISSDFKSPIIKSPTTVVEDETSLQLQDSRLFRNLIEDNLANETETIESLMRKSLLETLGRSTSQKKDGKNGEKNGNNRPGVLGKKIASPKMTNEPKKHHSPKRKTPKKHHSPRHIINGKDSPSGKSKKSDKSGEFHRDKSARSVEKSSKSDKKSSEGNSEKTGKDDCGRKSSSKTLGSTRGSCKVEKKKSTKQKSHCSKGRQNNSSEYGGEPRRLEERF